MPRHTHSFHMHTLDEIDVAQRLWGAAGVRAMLDIPPPHSSALAPTAARPHLPPRPRPSRAPRTGFVWTWLRRAPRSAVR